MSLTSDRRKLLDTLRAQGWTVGKWRSGHYKLTPPDQNAPIVTASLTPSDHRAWRNMIAQLRRSGAKI